MPVSLDKTVWFYNMVVNGMHCLLVDILVSHTQSDGGKYKFLPANNSNGFD